MRDVNNDTEVCLKLCHRAYKSYLFVGVVVVVVLVLNQPNIHTPTQTFVHLAHLNDETRPTGEYNPGAGLRSLELT